MKINEIFYSIQGEGFWTGTPAIFIRFAGCNLDCIFCDTDHSCKYTISVRRLVEKIKQYKCKHIVLTGGEPALQINNEFIRLLIGEGYYVQIETNGTRELPNNLDWITISPKADWEVKTGDELKVVYQGQDLGKYENADFKYYYLQPESEVNITETIEAVKENPKWKLSIQTQKLLKIR